MDSGEPCGYIRGVTISKKLFVGLLVMGVTEYFIFYRYMENASSPLTRLHSLFLNHHTHNNTPQAPSSLNYNPHNNPTHNNPKHNNPHNNQHNNTHTNNTLPAPSSPTTNNHNPHNNNNTLEAPSSPANNNHNPHNNNNTLEAPSSPANNNHNLHNNNNTLETPSSPTNNNHNPHNNSNTLEAPSSPANNNQNSSSSSRRVLCHMFAGRQGNQMFQYASVLGLAYRMGRTPVFLPGRNPVLGSILEWPPSLVTSSPRCKKSLHIREKNCCNFNEHLVKLDSAKDYTVAKYLQSWKYFEGAEEQVRKAMTFKKSILLAARTALQEELRNARLQDNNDNTTTNNNNNDSSATTTLLIGVHLRRGDYLRMSNKSGYVTPPADYFRRAMAYMRSRFANGSGNGKGKKGKKENSKNNVIFLVAVDTRKWFLENVTSSNDVIVLKRRSAAVDMALLSSLDHVIISVGTYSWWVGFLNRGVTVYWKDFVVPGTLIGDSYGRNGSTFVYPGWVPL